MRTKRCIFTISLLCGGLLAGVLDAAAQLRITEVLSAPASDWDNDGAVDSKFDEWVEVTNTGDSPMDLQDIYLRDGTGTAWHYGFSGSLAPGASLLVTGTTSFQWQADNGAGTSALSLNNSGDRIELWHAPEGERSSCSMRSTCRRTRPVRTAPSPGSRRRRSGSSTTA